MEDIKSYHQSINRLYRQIGKEIYEGSKTGGANTKRVDKMIKKIDRIILEVEAFKNIDSKDTLEEKNILLPEKNDVGLMVYSFCKSCRVGNHPDSTHCMNCGVKL